MFSKELLDHFQNPRNAGELPGATVSVEVSNPVCGDVLRLAAIAEQELSGKRASFAAAAPPPSPARRGTDCSRNDYAVAEITPETLAASFGELPPETMAHLA
jgi:hypothetical protein